MAAIATVTNSNNSIRNNVAPKFVDRFPFIGHFDSNFLLFHAVNLRTNQTGEGNAIALKVKFANYQQITRSRTVMRAICEVATIVSLAQELFEAVELEERNVRLLGISLSNLGGEERSFGASRLESSVQLVLF